MSLKDMFNRFKSGESRAPGPLAEAIQVLRQIITESQRNKATANSPIIKSVTVVLHSMKEHRDALDAAAAMVNCLTNPSPESAKDMPVLIAAFKTHAVRARLQQHVPLDNLPKLDAVIPKEGNA